MKRIIFKNNIFFACEFPACTAHEGKRDQQNYIYTAYF